MSRARLRQGRDAPEIGAAIIGAWLRLLPTPAKISDETNAAGTLRVTVDRAIFTLGQSISVRRAQSKSTDNNLKVHSVTPGAVNGSQDVTIKKQGGGNYPLTGTFIGGSVIPDVSSPTSDLEDELGAAISQVLDGVTAKVKFDTPGVMNIGVPMLPKGIFTRDDLLDYLRTYHEIGESRHYHDELGVAVLFGCR